MTDFPADGQYETELPSEVVAELNRVYGTDEVQNTAGEIPNEVDQAILADARRFLASIPARSGNGKSFFGSRRTFLSAGSILALLLLISLRPAQRAGQEFRTDSPATAPSPAAGADRFAAARQAKRNVAPLPGISLMMGDALLDEMPDINHDGHVDILDVLALAVGIEANQWNEFQWDVNQDSELNQLDVDQLVANILQLPNDRQEAAESLLDDSMNGRSLGMLRAAIPSNERESDLKRLLIQSATLDVSVDSGSVPLAAWQCELIGQSTGIEISGVEGGQDPAFREPPLFDLRAIQGDRISLAAYRTEPPFPVGRQHVARVLVELQGQGPHEITARLVAAAGADGERIEAEISVERTVHTRTDTDQLDPVP